MKACRFCGHTGLHEFVNLGHQPPSNSFLTKEQLNESETYYPLKLYVCDSCWLVQLPESKKAIEIFNDQYPYHSSQSPSNVSHAKEYVDMMCERFGYKETTEELLYTQKGMLNKDVHKILEIGSNDGYLLQWFKEKNIKCIGFEPSQNIAIVARSKGIVTIIDYFNSKTAKRFESGFDLICGINVLAHQPDINDFVEGLKIALKPDGVITMEFPHLMHLIDKCQFDTIYHEHYSYFSFATICTIFQKYGLEVFDVDELPEHGGSLRIYARHHRNISDYICRDYDFRKNGLRNQEQRKGIDTLSYYQDFQSKVKKIKTDFLDFLINNRSVAAYGAPAKGNTFLNYCGIHFDLIPFTVDRSPHKQGLYLPGSHIKVTNEDELKEMKPDYVLVLAWNLKSEIMEQLKYIREWGGKFVIAIPKLKVI